MADVFVFLAVSPAVASTAREICAAFESGTRPEDHFQAEMLDAQNNLVHVVCGWINEDEASALQALDIIDMQEAP